MAGGHPTADIGASEAVAAWGNVGAKTALNLASSGVGIGSEDGGSNGAVCGELFK